MADIQATAFGVDDKVIFTLGESQRILFPDGIYDFTVGKVEVGNFCPGPDSKLPLCGKMSYPLTITSKEGTGIVWHNLYLVTTQIWKIAQFFRGIGLMEDVKEGEEAAFPWYDAEGRTGRCKIGHHEHDGKTYNDVVEILLPEKTPEENEPEYHFND